MIGYRIALGKKGDEWSCLVLLALTDRPWVERTLDDYDLNPIHLLQHHSIQWI